MRQQANGRGKRWVALSLMVLLTGVGACDTIEHQAFRDVSGAALETRGEVAADVRLSVFNKTLIGVDISCRGAAAEDVFLLPRESVLVLEGYDPVSLRELEAPEAQAAPRYRVPRGGSATFSFAKRCRGRRCS